MLTLLLTIRYMHRVIPSLPLRRVFTVRCQLVLLSNCSTQLRAQDVQHN